MCGKSVFKILMFMGLLGAIPAQAQLNFSTATKKEKPTINDEIIISVRHELPQLLSDSWAKGVCQKLASIMQEQRGDDTKIHCFRPESKQEFEKISREEFPKINAHYWIDYAFEANGDRRIAVTDLTQKDPWIVKTTGWVAHSSTGDAAKRSRRSIEDTVNTKIKETLFMFDRITQVKQALVEVALEGQKLPVDDENQDKNYSLFKAQSKGTQEQKKNYLLAGSELLLAAGIGWLSYQNDSKTMQADWDFPGSFAKNLKNKIRFGDMVRYDDNTWRTNRNHVFAGVSYYTICRGNGLDALESYLCTIAGSTLWEVVTEWREVLSINDQVFTIHGGAILAESVHQMGRYIFARGPEWFKNSFGRLWSGPAQLNDWANKKIFNGQERKYEDEETKIAGKFEMELGIVNYRGGGSAVRMALNSEVINIPNFYEPGATSGFLMDIAQTELQIGAPLKAQILDQYDIFAKVVWAAYQQKQITKNGDELQGYTLFVGPSSALTIKNKTDYSNDFMGIVHVAGGSMRMTNFYKGYRITSSLDVWGDAVMMKSLLIEKNENDPAMVNGLVHNMSHSRYYHGYGYTTRGQIILEAGDWAYGAVITYTSATNTNARQRDRGLVTDVTKSFNASDEILDFEAFIEKEIVPNLKIRFRAGLRKHFSSMEGYGDTTAVEKRTMLSIVYHF